MATHDVADYAGLATLTERLRGIEADVADLEEQWLELAEDA